MGWRTAPRYSIPQGRVVGRPGWRPVKKHPTLPTANPRPKAGAITSAVARRGSRARLPLLATADVIAPAFGLGLAVGRVGCFLTGLHPGRPTTLPWGIEYLGAVRHPIPLYESVLGLLLLGLGLLLLKWRLPTGVTSIAVGLGYLLARPILDLLRAQQGVAGADPRLVGSLTLTQGIA